MRYFALAVAALLIVSSSSVTLRANLLELAMGPTSAPHKPGGNPNAAASPSESGSETAEMHHKKSKRRKSAQH